jgi:hypothetical protein
MADPVYRRSPRSRVAPAGPGRPRRCLAVERAWPRCLLRWRDREASSDGERIRVGDDAAIRLVDALPATGVAIVAHRYAAEAIARRHDVHHGGRRAHARLWAGRVQSGARNRRQRGRGRRRRGGRRRASADAARCKQPGQPDRSARQPDSAYPTSGASHQLYPRVTGPVAVLRPVAASRPRALGTTVGWGRSGPL